MKKNDYKAMAIAMAIGLATTPSVSFAAEMGHESVDEAIEESMEEGMEEEIDFDGEDTGAEETDDNWDAEEVGELDGEWEDNTEDAGRWEDDTEDIEEDWEEEDWEEEDWGEEDWEEEDWGEEDWEEEDWEDDEDGWEDDEDGWEEEDWEDDEDDWVCGSDDEQSRKWPYEYAEDADNYPGIAEEAPADPADPSYAVDEAEAPVCQKEAVPDDKTPYEADSNPAAGGIRNAQSSNPASKTIQKASKNLIRHSASIQAEYAASKDNALAGLYQAEGKIKLYSGAGEKKAVLAAAKKDAKIYCYGYYTEKDGENWLYVEYFQDGAVYTGFCKASMLKR